jgi:hypothetical protein
MGCAPAARHSGGASGARGVSVGGVEWVQAVITVAKATANNRGIGRGGFCIDTTSLLRVHALLAKAYTDGHIRRRRWRTDQRCR